MIQSDDKCLLLFQSIHRVMQTERLIISRGIYYQIIPVPKDYSSECGMCIEINCSDIDLLESELQSNGIIFNIVKVKS